MLSNKIVLVCGVANKRSIAWHVAQRFHKENASVIITYEKPQFKSKIQSLIDEQTPNNENRIVDSICCDITKDSELRNLCTILKEKYGCINSVFHSIAYAPSTALKNNVLDCSLEDFNITLSVSAYSLLSLTRAIQPLIQPNSSITAMSYIGSQQFIPNYGVMSIAKAALEATARQLAGVLGKQDIRVNILRSAPINTLAARGIPNFHEMEKRTKEKQMMKCEYSIENLCNTALFLASDLSSGITGENINDAGYSVSGL